MARPRRPDYAKIAPYWERAVQLVDEATTFPVEQLADRLVPAMLSFGDDDAFLSLVATVDDKVATQTGDVAVADKAAARGHALLQAENVIPALRQFHTAKDRFTEGHEITRALSTLIVISHLYEQLDLHQAAKYYALAAAAIAVNSPDPADRRYVTAGLSQAVASDYATGAWRGCLEHAATALAAHLWLDSDPGNDDRYPYLTDLTSAAGFLLATCVHHVPQFEAAAAALAEPLLPEEMISAIRAGSGPYDWLIDRDLVISRCREQLACRPFDDCADTRTLSWSAFGTGWRLEASNDPDTVRAAERLAAVIQVMQADLADFDLVPLAKTFTVQVSLNDDPSVREASPDSTADLLAYLPRWSSDPSTGPDDLKELSLVTFVVAMTTLRHSTMLSRSEFVSVVEERMTQELANKATVFRSYDEVASSWDINRLDPTDVSALGVAPPPPASSPHLAAPGGPGPGYNADEAASYLATRYANLRPATSRTVDRLRRLPDFQETIRALRADGRLDWQILTAILALAHSWRANQQPTNEEALAAMARPPDDSIDVPTELFTTDVLRDVAHGNDITSLIQTWGRTLNIRRQPTPHEVRPILDRYRHFDDDIEHDDPFAE